MQPGSTCIVQRSLSLDGCTQIASEKSWGWFLIAKSPEILFLPQTLQVWGVWPSEKPSQARCVKNASVQSSSWGQIFPVKQGISPHKSQGFIQEPKSPGLVLNLKLAGFASSDFELVLPRILFSVHTWKFESVQGRESNIIPKSLGLEKSSKIPPGTHPHLVTECHTQALPDQLW